MATDAVRDTRSAFSRTLEDHLAEWSRRTGVAVEVWALPGAPVPGHVADVVHATVRDVLGNVARHTRAGTVSLALTVSTAGLQLTVSDDGAGTTAEALAARRLPTRADIAELGGRLGVHTVPGAGTTVSVAIPAPFSGTGTPRSGPPPTSRWRSRRGRRS